MQCVAYQEAISAVADGEAAPIDERLVAAHLLRCPACTEYRDGIERTRRPMRLGVAVSPPDLSARVSARQAVDERRAVARVARWGLLAVAGQILVFSVPSLLGAEQGASAHAARHLGAFTAAFAVGLLAVVVRPARARAMLPVAGVLSGALLITAVVDLVGGHVPFAGEITHLPEMASWVLLWVLQRPLRPLPAAGADQIERSRAALRAVDGSGRRSETA